MLLPQYHIMAVCVVNGLVRTEGGGFKGTFSTFDHRATLALPKVPSFPCTNSILKMYTVCVVNGLIRTEKGGFKGSHILHI